MIVTHACRKHTAKPAIPEWKPASFAGFQAPRVGETAVANAPSFRPRSAISTAKPRLSAVLGGIRCLGGRRTGIAALQKTAQSTPFPRFSLSARLRGVWSANTCRNSGQTHDSLNQQHLENQYGILGALLGIGVQRKQSGGSLETNTPGRRQQVHANGERKSIGESGI